MLFFGGNFSIVQFSSLLGFRHSVGLLACLEGLKNKAALMGGVSTWLGGVLTNLGKLSVSNKAPLWKQQRADYRNGYIKHSEKLFFLSFYLRVH